MATNNKKKITWKQSVWLLMAVFCMFCSSAIKKMIQIRLERQVTYAADHQSLTKRIKDGSRERREFLHALVYQQNHNDNADNQDIIPFFLVPCILFLAFLPLLLQKRNNMPAGSYATGLSGIPLYLQLCRLQV